MENELDVVSSGSALTTGKPAFSLASLNLAQNCPAVVVAPTGAKLSKYPFPKVKFEEGRRVRLSILTREVMMIRLHYHPEVGYILCDGGACCKYCDKVNVKYCYPCVVYDTDSTGKIISNNTEMKLLALGGEMYSQISLLNEMYSITEVDLLFLCTSAQYQKCQVTQAGKVTWSTNDSMAGYVTEYMQTNGSKILDALGRVYTADELAIKLGEPGAPVADQKCISADALNDIYRV